MEFSEKLQELRKQKKLTQEELAQALYVSRAAISKWEAGRGYPSIDSLKAIAAFFSVSIDDLLSGSEVLSIAEEDHRQRENHVRDLVFGLLDCSVAVLLFLPFFGEQANGVVNEVSLLVMAGVAPWLKAAYLLVTVGMVAGGILTLALQNCSWTLWVQSKTKLSVCLGAVGAFLFILGRQPYAASLVFVFLIIKLLVLIKKQ